ncbi:MULTISPECIES: CPBP family intramembrane glutamic endopeptidase [Streptomyces]|uniref:CPBP family intramembrane glutamic endopeptidase n=1 Tax=Streptomyces lienomycini TaxID=284035 RepID=A0ABV9WWT3_9ACTN|nr:MULTISPECIES: CPBP family intramembrane glutamic endopeptidase [Streptomyces]
MHTSHRTPDASTSPTSSTPPTTPVGSYRTDLTLFMVIAFAVSWLSWGAAIALGGTETNEAANGPYMLGAFGPLVGALVIRLRRRRRGEPVPEHAVPFRAAHLPRAVLLLVLGSATVLAAALLASRAGGPELSLDVAKDAVEDFGGPAAFFVGMLVSGPLSEEPGWRGTAYPRLRAKLGTFRVCLILGVVWAVWHLPLFFVDGTVQHDLGLATPSGVLFVASNIPMAMLVTAAYERAGIVASIAVHFAVNTTMVLLAVEAPEVQAMTLGIQLITVTVLLRTRRATSGPTGTPAGGRTAPRAHEATAERAHS